MFGQIKSILKKSRFLRMINFKYVVKPNTRITTYSQFGEDIISESALESLDIDMNKMSYLDIGANHPTSLSNTFYFYDKYNVHGVLIEPDESLCEVLQQYREKDLTLNVGIGLSDLPDSKDFYKMSIDVLNTFSKEEAEKIDKLGKYSIKQIIPVTLYSFNYIMEKYLKSFGNKVPELVSLDVEGFELPILESIDFKKYRPKVFIIETQEFVGGNKKVDVIEFMLDNGYKIYADTHLNTIFIDK